MSKEAYVDFYENYLKSPAGEVLRKKLDTARDGDEFLAIATEGGSAAGFEFTKDEVRDVMRASEAQMAKAAAEAAGEELSDEQLENVAGGASGLPLITVSIRSRPGFQASREEDHLTLT